MTFDADHKSRLSESSPFTTEAVIPEPASSLNSAQPPFNSHSPSSPSYSNPVVLPPYIHAYSSENIADWLSSLVDSDEIPLSGSDSANLATVTNKLATYEVNLEQFCDWENAEPITSCLQT